MANIHPDITPRGLNQKDLINLLYMIVSSIQGICAVLDADDGVALTTYEANAYTAIFNTIIEDTRGNRTGLYRADKNFYSISPYGESDPAMLELAYEIYNSINTLTAQLDLDGTLSDTDYNDNVYVAKCIHMITDQSGNTLGNGKAFWFNPGSGMNPQRELVDLLYNLVDAIETLTAQIDVDTGDTTIEATWFTANILLRVENSQGNVVGNTSTHLG